MKRTSHTTHRHKRRQPILGLTPDDVVKQMAEDARGENVRNVRKSDKSKAPVLSETREGEAPRGSTGGIFAAPPIHDAGRPGSAGSDAVPDTSGTQLTRILKRMLGQSPPSELLDVDEVGRLATNAEALAAVVMREALAGKQWAIEMVRDQTEGKPIRAAQVNNSDVEVEGMLDRVSQAQLNSIAKGE